MKTKLAILSLALALLPAFAQVKFQGFTTNSGPILADTIRSNINGTTGTGNAVFGDQPIMTNVTVNNITNVALTVNRFVLSGAGKKQVDQGSSSWLIDTLDDESGTGVALFSFGPSITNANFYNPTFIGGNSSGLAGATNGNWPDMFEGFNYFYCVPTTGGAVQYGPASWTTALTGGTAALFAGTATNMGYQAFATDGSSNRSLALYQGTVSISSAWRPQAAFKFAISNVTTIAFFAGLSADTTTYSSVTNSVLDTVGLRFNTLLGDTTYKIVTQDGTAVSTIDTGITPTNSLQMTFWMAANDTTGTNWSFYMNRQFIATATNNMPRTTALLRPLLSFSNKVTATRAAYLYYFNVRVPGNVNQ